MKDGRIEQMGTAEEIYDRPVSRFVADFVGQINLLAGTLVGRDGAYAVVEVNAANHRVRAAPEASGAVTVGLRPQHLRLVDGGAPEPGLNVLSGRIRGRTFSGNVVHVDVDLDGGQSVTVETSPETVVGNPGTQVGVAWRPDRGTVLTH
jgi:ABC-type Fe3+/spermidine/putrescine transport system ATPase subunit